MKGAAPHTGAVHSVNPLRILQIGSQFENWGGIELHLLTLSAELRTRGHQVSILAQPDLYLAREAARRGIPVFDATDPDAAGGGDFGVLLRLLRCESFDVIHVHWRGDHVAAPLAAYLHGVPVVVTHHMP